MRVRYQKKTRGKKPTTDSGSGEYRGTWNWPDDLTDFLASKLVSPSLVVGAGGSPIADYNVDQLPATTLNERADGFRINAGNVIPTDADSPYGGQYLRADMFRNNLPFPDNSFKSILADPPWRNSDGVDIRQRCDLWFELTRILEPGGVIFHNATWLPPLPIVNMEMTGIAMRQDNDGGRNASFLIETTTLRGGKDLADLYDYSQTNRPDTRWQDGLPEARFYNYFEDLRVVSARKEDNQYNCPRCQHNILEPIPPARSQTTPPTINLRSKLPAFYECDQCGFRATKDEIFRGTDVAERGEIRRLGIEQTSLFEGDPAPDDLPDSLIATDEMITRSWQADFHDDLASHIDSNTLVVIPRNANLPSIPSGSDGDLTQQSSLTDDKELDQLATAFEAATVYADAPVTQSPESVPHLPIRSHQRLHYEDDQFETVVFLASGCCEFLTRNQLVNELTRVTAVDGTLILGTGLKPTEPNDHDASYWVGQSDVFDLETIHLYRFEDAHTPIVVSTGTVTGTRKQSVSHTQVTTGPNPDPAIHLDNDSSNTSGATVTHQDSENSRPTSEQQQQQLDLDNFGRQ